MKLEEACARLKAGGLRITRPRIAMLNAMLCHTEPRSLEDLHQDLGGACDLVTVYRSVASMERVGLVRRIFGVSGVGLYQLNLAPERYHVVTKDGQIIALDETVPSPEMRLSIQAIEDRLRASGFTGVSHVIEFFAETSAPTPSLDRPGSSGEFISGL